MTLKFTDAIEDMDERNDLFIEWVKEAAPELLDTVLADKNFTAGDAHVSAAGGDGKKKKPKKPPRDVDDISVGYAGMDHKRFEDPDQSFDDFLRFVDEGGDVAKLKLKTKLECEPSELKALLDANPKLKESLAQIIYGASSTASVGKDAGTRTIRVCRHGATHLNDNDTSVDRVRGWKDVPLSAEGKDEAAKLAEKMAKDPPDHLVCSDLKRAHDTAKMIAAACDMPIDEVSSGFRPWNVGKYAGVSSKEAVPILARYAVEKPDEAIPEGESFNKFRSRFFGALADASEEYPDGVLAVVTHHRGERLIAAWQAAGFPEDGSMDAKVFTKKGESTAGAEDVEIPIDKLKAAAAANVTKFVNGPLDYSKVFQDEPETVDKSFELNVCKVIEEKRIFYGWASVSEENGKIIIDKQGDYIDPDDLLAAAEDFTLYGGNLGDMHEKRNVGRVVASLVTHKSITGPAGISVANDRVGWLIGFKVDDPEVWAKIRAGGQLELSIGGRGERVPL